MLKQKMKQTARKLIQLPSKVNQYLHFKYPKFFGHHVVGAPVQLYRNDSHFHTAISFNHFVEFFSNIAKMDLKVVVEAFDRHGSSLGIRTKELSKKGNFQILLSELYSNLDEFGLFSIEMKVQSEHIEELSYLGSLYPQYMTVFIPNDGVSSAQILHSHKIRQGKLLVSRTLRRASSNIESSQGIKSVTLYFLNSSASTLKAEVDILSGETGQKIKNSTVTVQGHGVTPTSFSAQDIPTESYHLEYQFDRNVDHKKPILFREFKDGSMSCNHT